MTARTVARELRFLKVYSAVLTIGLVWALVENSQAQTARQRFTEIDVERINVIAADGRLSAVIANKDRMARIILDGREQPADRVPARPAGGIVFTDGDGNEAGGLIFASGTLPDGTAIATRSLTFDQHHQDQVLGIQYIDQIGKSRSYGLSLWDRPSEMTTAEAIEVTRGAPDQQTRRARIAAALKAKGVTQPAEARRIFLGSQDAIPSLRFADALGRERIRLLVDEGGSPHLEFLNEAGAVMYSVPPR